MERTGSQLVLSQEEAFARIRLLRSPRIGPVSYRQLLARFGTAEAALEALPEMGSRGGTRLAIAAKADIEREVEGVRKAKAAYLFHDQPDYPELLAELESAPPILTFRGDKALANRPCVAIVGARNASAAAIKLARDLASDLVDQGFVIVSGLARGVDGSAHQATLPQTIGVIASGIEIAYPPEHTELQEQIARDGLLIAEQPPETEPRGRHFPSRNRIIAGLSLGTVVIEAAPRSGSLITARLAAEAGREVMAVPGSPLETRAQGCNHLIREGATLVQSAGDVIELVSGFDNQPRSRLNVDMFPDRPVTREPAIVAGQSASAKPNEIAELLSPTPITVDEIVRQSGASLADVQSVLLELELAGELVRQSGGTVSIVASDTQ